MASKPIATVRVFRPGKPLAEPPKVRQPPARRAVNFPGIKLRSDAEIQAILSICAPCKRFNAGKCTLCKSCGSTRVVSDFARLSIHHCPQKPPLW